MGPQKTISILYNTFITDNCWKKMSQFDYVTKIFCFCWNGSKNSSIKLKPKIAQSTNY